MKKNWTYRSELKSNETQNQTAPEYLKKKNEIESLFNGIGKSVSIIRKFVSQTFMKKMSEPIFGYSLIQKISFLSPYNHLMVRHETRKSFFNRSVYFVRIIRYFTKFIFSWIFHLTNEKEWGSMAPRLLFHFLRVNDFSFIQKTFTVISVSTHWV